MRIRTITFMYNEAHMAPLFLRHYACVDSILVFLDKSEDNTESILRSDPRVTIVDFNFSNGFNDVEKVNAINQAISDSKDFDWVFAVDSDEFIWPACFTSSMESKQTESFKPYLSGVTGDFAYANMWNVYRHISDKDLDYSASPALQRRHGDPARFAGNNAWYSKPIVIRTGNGITLNVGNHSLVGQERFKQAPQKFDGAHWGHADPSFCVKRRMERKARMGEFNKANGMGVHNFTVTEDEVTTVCRQHENDPLLF